MIDTLLHLLQFFAIFAGGIWAVHRYNRNSYNKTIEVLVTLEQEYRKYHPFLLQIEMNYDDIKPVLKRQEMGLLTQGDYPIMEKLDGVLRHFYVCLRAKELKVIDPITADKMYGYYLRMLCNSNTKQLINIDRMELADYINKYWPSIGKWAAESQLSRL